MSPLLLGLLRDFGSMLKWTRMICLWTASQQQISWNIKRWAWMKHGKYVYMESYSILLLDLAKSNLQSLKMQGKWWKCIGNWFWSNGFLYTSLDSIFFYWQWDQLHLQVSYFKAARHVPISCRLLAHTEPPGRSMIIIVSWSLFLRVNITMKTSHDV